MQKFLRFYRLADDEDGAVTVDWVVLTAAIVLLGVLVTVGIRAALISESQDIALVINVIT